MGILSRSLCVAAALFCFQIPTFAQAVFNEGTAVPVNGRWNPLDVPASQYQNYVQAGRKHVHTYPIETTGMLPPYEPIRRLMENTDTDPLRRIINNALKGFVGIKNIDDFFAWVGLNPFPAEEDTGVYAVPYPNGVRPDYRMGLSFMERDMEHGRATGFSIACVACHSGRLFGKTVVGMTNRFPRAMETFLKAKSATGMVPASMFQAYTGATDAETDLYREAADSLKSVAAKKPIQLGLDTSLAQISLSLNRREQNPWADRSEQFERNPRVDPILDRYPADSKPAVWWNVKYKNRWFADGSLVSGNPVMAAILANELGRGSDLRTLDRWITENEKTIAEWTTAVFSVEAPHITDFVSADRFDLQTLRHGQQLFNNTCSRCHGVYEKNWDQPNAQRMPWSEQLKTAVVRYPERSRVVDVGTDPYRWRGMHSLEKLNDLAISQRFNGVIRGQQGYVPPPLVGIWARWPYFHNNSVPSLCAVLTRATQRPREYWAGGANDIDKDFDLDCNGYPSGNAVPREWKRYVALKYQTHRRGMSNSGHDVGIFIDENGQERFTPSDKQALIRYLQTL